MKEIARINKNNTINATVISLKKSSFYSLALSQLFEASSNLKGNLNDFNY